VGDPRYPATRVTLEILAAGFIALFFKNQKNAVQGESTGRGHSFDDVADPVKLVSTRAMHLNVMI